VLEAFLSGARKKRKVALFVELHRLPITNDDQQYQEFNVLVAEDKRSQILVPIGRRRNSNVIRWIYTFSHWQTHHIFFLWELVVTCRELNRQEQNLGANIDVRTGQFHERNTSIDGYLPKT